MSAFVVRSQRAVTPGGLRPADVVVRAGSIEAVLEHGAAPAELPVEDGGELALLPGLVDTHVHVNEPGRTEWEGYTTATQAAAAGGITTLVDMPLNCLPVTTTEAALDAKLAALEGQLWIDCGFWGGVIPGNAAELAPMAARGVAGFKAFLVHSGIDEFPNATEATLREAMPRLAAAGVPLLAHAELELDAPDAAGASPRDYATYLASRPKAWEDAAIALLIELCRETGCAVHVVHLSSSTALPLLAAAQAEGLPISAETCPHYLCLTAEEVPAGATAFKCAPPIREATNREALWAGLRAGTLDVVVSDHSPCTPQLKLPERGDFLEAWGGIASLQLGLRAIWTEASARGHTLTDLVGWMAERPARLAGLPHKGRLAAGCDADLVLFDPDATEAVDAARLLHRHKVTPYADRRLRGAVQTTWLRGQVVARDGEVLGEARGRPVWRGGDHG